MTNYKIILKNYKSYISFIQIYITNYINSAPQIFSIYFRVNHTKEKFLQKFMKQIYVKAVEKG